MRLSPAVYGVALCLAGAFRLPAQSLALTISSAPDAGALILSLNPGDPPPAAVQWTVTYPPGRAIDVSVVAGPSSTDAGKSVACASTADSSTCVVSGSGGRSLGPGILARIAATGNAPAPVWISRAVAVSPDGVGKVIPATGGGPSLESMACSPAASASAAATCRVQLSAAAPRGGVEVSIAFDPGYVDAPWSVVASEGADVVSFDAKPAFGRASNSATITASLDGAAISTHVALPAPGAAQGLIASYAFDEGAGDEIYDYSGGNNTGWIDAAQWTAGGHDGGALVFDGEQTYVDIGDPGGQSAATTAGSMTWSAWVYPSGVPPDDGQIVSRSMESEGWQLKTTPDTGQRTFGVAVASESGTYAQRYSASAVSLNTWYFVAGVYNAASRTLDIYVNGSLNNGALTGNVPDRMALAPVNANIGRRYGGYYFQGVIDDVRIYERALSSEEIRADMEKPVAAPLVSARLTSLVCEPANIPAGGDSECTATLSAPAPEDTVIAISAGTPLVSVPGQITVPMGESTAVFQVSAAPAARSGRTVQLRSPARTVVSASLGPDTVRTAVAVVPAP